MKQQIRINKLIGWSQLTENILRSVAQFNKTGEGILQIEGFERYVAKYNAFYPKGIFNYSTKRSSDYTLEVYEDDDLLLSISMI